MSNQGIIIEERSRDIGDFLVGRLLPFRKKRMVGPFIFIDHMGPTELGNGNYMDVDQHPHIGLSTLTYLLEGELMHADSLGTSQRIKPGSVNWMTAGSGVTHTERTPQELRTGEFFTVHGYQIWVALPKELEEMNPEFHHFTKEEIPAWQEGGLDFRLIAGKAYGRISPVPVHSDLFMVEIKAKKSASFSAAADMQGEIGICIVSGSISACAESIPQGNMLVSKQEDICDVTLEKDSHIFIFGGKPFPEERHIAWNFVSSSKEKIEAAKARWQAKSFPQVPNDDSYIPLP
ncbi:pirin family protein [Gangjinia marincola]|uniref:Pirin family protein n=1 Tax=Gangjinia marincola TaxID=578463 RepID=A0ABN1MJ46_9FLAO